MARDSYPTFPPPATFSRQLLETKAKAHFGEAWEKVMATLDAKVDRSHISDWPEWRRTMFKLDCLFLAGWDERALDEMLRTLDDDYRMVVWAAEEQAEDWIEWLNRPELVARASRD